MLAIDGLSQFIAVVNQEQLWSVVVVVLGAIVGRVFRLKPRLLYSVGHSANILVEEPLIGNDGNQISPRQLIRTASITLRNSGLKTTNGVEVTFNWKPHFMSLNPARSHTDLENPHGRYTLRFESLAPSEAVTVEILAINNELPAMTAVRSDDCGGELIAMAPQQIWPNWYLRVLAALLLLGGVTAIYLLISLVQAVAT